MPKLSFRIEADYDKVIRLREEIAKLKQEIKGVDVTQTPQAFNVLNTKLQDLTKQYDSLVAKAAEADAKIMESAARMDKAVDSITKAHEKAEKAAMKQTSSTGTKTQTEAVEGQAKAYLDLKDEIDAILGTREQNIRQMMQEQNAIKLINAEIAQINRSRQSSGRISQTQAQRLQTLNGDLLMHRQALAEVRQELANNAKLDLAAVGSMNELSQSLSRMRIAYRALNEDERNSEFGQNLLKSIQEADAKIKELDATIGSHQRNVGNYQGSFNGLNMSVQQIVRELPAAKMGINMFFMAISNNLPIMADQIKLAKEANKAMKEAGQEPVPVWRQLVSSLFSWQSAMMVGITLLTVYGKDIANWVKELFKANDAQGQARKEAEAFTKTVQKAHEEWRNSVAQTAAQQITEYRKMQREWNKLGNDLNAKKKYVDANRDAFHQLGFAVNGVSDAERVMTGNTDAVVASIMARAKASAYYAQMQEATERYIKQTDYNKSTVAGGGYKRIFKAGQELSVKDLEYYEKTYGLKLTNGSIGSTGALDIKGNPLSTTSVLTAAGAKKLQDAEIKDAIRRRKENDKKAKNQLDKQISFLQDGLEATVKENQGLLKKIGVSEYKDYEDRKEKQKKESVAKQVDYDKMAREQSEAERNLENAVAQSRIDAMQEGYEKEKAQRELNHKKELEDIDKKRSDFLRRKIDDAKRIFDADPKNKGKKFDYSSVTLTGDENAKFDEMRANAKIKHANEDTEAEKSGERAMREYLKQYGTYEEKHLAIAKEYAEKIAKVQSEGERKSLKKQEQAEHNNLDIDELKKNINWEFVFGNIDGVDMPVASAVKDQLEQFLDMSKDLSPEQIKAVVDAMSQLQEKMDLAEPLKSIREARKEYAAAKAEYDKYLQSFNAAKNSGDAKGQNQAANGMIKASQKMVKAKNREAKSFKEVTDIVQDYADALKDAGSVIGGIAGECVSLAASALSAGTSMAQGIEQFGNAVSDMEKSVAILAIIEAALKAIQIIMDTFGGKEDATLTDYVSTMDTYIKLLDDDIAALDKSMKSAKNTMKGTIAYYEQLVALGKESATAIKSQSQVWLNSGAKKGFLGIGSKSSEGVKIVKQMKKDLESGNEEVRKFYERGYDTLSQFFKKVNGRLARGVKDFGRMDWIWKLSDDDLAKLSKDAGAMSLLGDTLSSAIKKYVDKMNIVSDGMNREFESLLDVSYDNFYDGFTEMISNMDNDSRDFANNFAEYMRKALIKDMVASQYKTQLESLYKQAGEYARAGTLDDHVGELKDQYRRLAASAQGQARMIDSITGYSETDSQKATINEARSLSEDTGSRIVGLITAIQIAVERGNVQRESIVSALSNIGVSSIDTGEDAGSVSPIANVREQMRNSYTPQVQVSFPKEELLEIKSEITSLKFIVDEMRTFKAEDIIEQRSISQNTESIAKNGKEIKSTLENIKRDVSNW